MSTPDFACFTRNIVVVQGGAEKDEMGWDIADVPVDLTGCTARMQVRATYDATDVLVDLDSASDEIVLGGVAGTVQPIIDETVTAALTPGDYVYDIELTWPDGLVQKFARGTFTVLPGVTR